MIKGTKWISQQWIREDTFRVHFSPHVIAFYDFQSVESQFGGVPDMSIGGKYHLLVPGEDLYHPLLVVMSSSV
jgi:hypothetical protein